MLEFAGIGRSLCLMLIFEVVLKMLFTQGSLSIVLGLVLGLSNASIHKRHGKHWVDTWVGMPQLTEPANLPPAPFVSPSYITNNDNYFSSKI